MLFDAQIDLSTAAFTDPTELPRILRKIADVLTEVGDQEEPDFGTVRDINGNSVGQWSIQKTE